MENIFKDKFQYCHSGSWTSLYKKSAYGIFIRGFGRSAFMGSEIIQMGRVPIYVYNDFNWIPYKKIWNSSIQCFQNFDSDNLCPKY